MLCGFACDVLCCICISGEPYLLIHRELPEIPMTTFHRTRTYRAKFRPKTQIPFSFFSTCIYKKVWNKTYWIFLQVIISLNPSIIVICFVSIVFYTFNIIQALLFCSEHFFIIKPINFIDVILFSLLWYFTATAPAF